MIKRCCTKDCPGRRPACHDSCETYKAWKQELQKEKAYTKEKEYAGTINRNDFEQEFWMGKTR